MKVCIISVVDVTRSLKIAFEDIGWKVFEFNPSKTVIFPIKSKIHHLLFDLLYIKNYYRDYYFDAIQRKTLRLLKREKFDLIVVYNNSLLNKETLLELRSFMRCPILCYAADDPTLTLPNEKYLETMLAFTHIVTFDSSTKGRILKYSNPKIINLPGAVHPKIFYPILNNESNQEYELAYCSSSNQATNLGLYRGAILSRITDFNLTIFGDSGWYKIAKSFPKLKNCIKVKYLNHEELNKLYNNTKIFISLVNPTLINGIPLRVFEIAGAKSFQIAEFKEDFKKWFPNDEVETFKTIPELREKINYYLSNPKEREEKAKALHDKVLKDYNWNIILREILNFVYNH